jgi:hypothetical protein
MKTEEDEVIVGCSGVLMDMKLPGVATSRTATEQSLESIQRRA